jgi:hypothetical protein
VYPFSLKRFFEDNLGHPIELDLYEGTEPTKAAFEAADIYMDDGSGWVDPAKLNTFVTTGNTLVRRWVLPDFSKDIIPQSQEEILFNISTRPSTAFLLSNNADNRAAAGNVSWFMLKSRNDAGTTIHYFFTGSVTDTSGSGDLRLLRTNLTESDFIIPNDMLVNLGQLTTV